MATKLRFRDRFEEDHRPKWLRDLVRKLTK